MQIKTTDSLITFQFYKAELVRYPSLSLDVEVNSRDFGGRVYGVWFRLSDFEEFLRQLEALEQSRQGEARLRCMSDGFESAPLRFRIFSTDVLGHMAIEAEILKTAYLGYQVRLVANKVAVNFDIEPSTLPTILNDFKALLAEAQR
ncbi:MAG: hypothetical protein GC204_05055 [Chloroflexi bacterium]|nr:hypothetical protein [Chloroflexota bacterium]